MLISRGDLLTFLERPISAVFVALSVLLILVQVYFWLRGRKGSTLVPEVTVGFHHAEHESGERPTVLEPKPVPVEAGGGRVPSH